MAYNKPKTIAKKARNVSYFGASYMPPLGSCHRNEK